MVSSVVLLISLSFLAVHGQMVDYSYYFDYYDVTDSPFDATTDPEDWLYELVEHSNACDPNPCLNAGSCVTGSNSDFTCLCPEPYTGKKCQRVKNVCQNIQCGRGDCVVNLKKPPFYECKCKPPYQGPDCKSVPASACEVSTCQNGGTCVKKNRRFRCTCREGYTGKFCEIIPNDCYEGNGETYTGLMSVTEDGLECLDWNSYTVLVNAGDPFTTYPGNTGIGFHNHCRNPDGDERPWCFVKKNKKLDWGFCNVKKCTAPTRPDASATTAPKPVPGDSTNFSQCGKPELNRGGRIIGGAKSAPGAHPWQVSLQVKSRGSFEDFSHICGGTLIKSCWVLTAAHCILPQKDLQVVLGGVDISKDEVIDQTIPVEQVIVHPNYRESSSGLYNDIALLRLKVTDSPYCAKESRYVKTACVPDQPFSSGKDCVVSGWGQTEESRHSDHLLDARVLLISPDRCKQPHVYGSDLDDSMLCAGIMQGGTDSCKGDSGGPLVCERDDTHYLAGVVSWGDGCGVQNKPGVYANVHKFNNWINSQIN